MVAELSQELLPKAQPQRYEEHHQKRAGRRVKFGSGRLIKGLTIGSTRLNLHFVQIHRELSGIAHTLWSSALAVKATYIDVACQRNACIRLGTVLKFSPMD